MSYGGGGSEGLSGAATSDSNVRTDGDTFGVNSEAPSGVGREGVEGQMPKDARK